MVAYIGLGVGFGVNFGRSPYLDIAGLALGRPAVLLTSVTIDSAIQDVF